MPGFIFFYVEGLRPLTRTTLLLLSMQCTGGCLRQSRALGEAACPTAIMALTLMELGKLRYGGTPCSGSGRMGQSPEDFDSASLEEE